MRHQDSDILLLDMVQRSHVLLLPRLGGVQSTSAPREKLPVVEVVDADTRLASRTCRLPSVAVMALRPSRQGPAVLARAHLLRVTGRLAAKCVVRHLVRSFDLSSVQLQVRSHDFKSA